MAPVAKNAKKNITAAKLRGSGLLRKSIGVQAKKYTRRGIIWVGVGPRTGFRQAVTLKNGQTVLRNPIQYAHLIEKGFRSRGGAALPGRAYLRAAMLSQQGTIEGRLASELAKQIPKIAAQLTKK